MTPTEFSSWLSLHQRLIPSVASWLGSQSDRSLLLDEWAAVLSPCSLLACEAASRAIVSGEMDRPFPEDTAAKVRAWAIELDAESRRSRHKEVSHNPKLCELCSNTGIASIWHPLLVRAIRENCDYFRNPKTGQVVRVMRDDMPLIKTAGVPCKCSLGDRYAQSTRYSGKQQKEIDNGRFGDSRNHVPIVSHEYIDDIMLAKPDNYVDEFDSF